MNTEKLTLGKAIDLLLSALEPLDEASRETALLAVSRQLNIATGLGQNVVQQIPILDADQCPPAAAHAPPLQRVDIRTLKEQKKPNSARQMACIVAYYLKELADAEEKKDSISTTDLEKYFKQAGFKLPTAMAQVLVDAKASGYFESTTRGEYKLNAVGYNLVAHNLPGGS